MVTCSLTCLDRNVLIVSFIYYLVFVLFWCTNTKIQKYKNTNTKTSLMSPERGCLGWWLREQNRPKAGSSTSSTSCCSSANNCPVKVQKNEKKGKKLTSCLTVWSSSIKAIYKKCTSSYNLPAKKQKPKRQKKVKRPPNPKLNRLPTASSLP